MHGLINRALQDFLRDAHGREAWAAIAGAADVDVRGFEAMLTYPDALTEAVLDAASAHLHTPRAMILEDLGTYLVSDPSMEALRRLLRFGGANFMEFLYSLDHLPDRARLAVPDLDLPDLTLTEDGRQSYTLHCRDAWAGFCPILQGILRAMADDYGVLVMLDITGLEGPRTAIRIRLLDMRFARGRDFSLKGAAAP
ncbi:heme NO-binding domain-containing protein [Rhodovulum adriaticum]|uniref:Heme-NO-binding protein n=1 Tax=Rhodovulum adriaticum TaxID=35804 RepID=A0A4R2NY31_RHOAD|nr:heme NO-binding domain-containing protein [Rhodovulum adriaticum]MBK1636386.1 hypothetical protein [Rhodovulum adriaticum]TCP26441.1 heme-NO-binding protein [Rhodovulum adriaticum]